MTDPLTASFTLRRDHLGLRPVYNLGNELGDCPYRCAFCGVGRSERVSPAWNVREFDRQHHEFLSVIDGPYHPVVYNQGNVTNPEEFSRATLDHILRTFVPDERVNRVSLNSREKDAPPDLLESLAGRALPFPVHFIFGVETFSPRSAKILGKDTRGELERFNAKLRQFNRSRDADRKPAAYIFGLDLNLVFLPELYLEDSESRDGNDAKSLAGFQNEVSQLLRLIDPGVPVDINLHPYYEVATLPWASADLDIFMSVVPSLQEMVDRYNAEGTTRSTHIFIGVEGTGYEEEHEREQLARWKDLIEDYNRSGRCSWVAQYSNRTVVRTRLMC